MITELSSKMVEFSVELHQIHSKFAYTKSTLLFKVFFAINLLHSRSNRKNIPCFRGDPDQV